jgi:hypothetical protein
MIKFLFLLTLFLGLSMRNYAQENETFRVTLLSDSQIDSSGAAKLIFTSNLDDAKEYAFNDIKNLTPFLLIFGGIAPSFSFDELNFEKKYNVYYYRFGCSFPDKKIANAYNTIILDFFENKFGSDCIKDISNNVFGINDWKNSKTTNN